MSATAGQTDDRTAEERAEVLMERIGREGARLFGRMREELEDIVAEAREIRQPGRTSDPD